MDLLSVAYGASSDDEEAESEAYSIPPPKRHRPHISPPQYKPTQAPSLSLANQPHRFPPPPLLPGRYISKRERETANLSASSKESETPIFPSTSAIKFEALASLRSQGKYASSSNKLPTSLSVSLAGHTKAVNSVQWSNNYGKLLQLFFYLIMLNFDISRCFMTLLYINSRPSSCISWDGPKCDHMECMEH